MVILGIDENCKIYNLFFERYDMADNTSESPTPQSENKQPTKTSHSDTNLDNSDPQGSNEFQEFWRAFATWKSVDDKEAHMLYQTYEPLAESIKITIQMFIGFILGVAVLIDGLVFLCSSFSNPSPQWIAHLNPLNIIAYGLFFSTGVDLAYMLFTPGPDEAIDPVMTGLAAAILLGIGKTDFSQIQLAQGVALFLAVAALGGLFAAKKYLFDHSNKQENDTRKKQEK